MQSMVDYQIRRTNRNLLIVNIALVLPVLCFAFLFLETIPYRGGADLIMAVIFLFFLSLLLIVPVWNIRKYIKRAKMPAVHPIHHSLSGYGELNTVIMDIDNEFRLESNLIRLPKCTLTTSWLLVPRMFTVNFVRLSDIIWIYKHHMQYSINFIPASVAYKSILVTRYGGQLEIAESETRVNKTLNTIYESAPWVQIGYSEELKRLREENLKQFILAIDARRQQIHPNM